MKYAILLPAACVAGLFPLFAPEGSPDRAAAQQPAESPAESKVLGAFLERSKVDEDKDSKLTKLLKERHNSAVTLLEERIKEYKAGRRDINSVYEAARFAAEAKLDLAGKDEEKIKVLEQTLAVAKLAEAQVEQQLKKGFGSKGDLERARYARLSLEVELLRANQKAKSGSD
jgi:hypothetical protein